ncbi:MAG: hypothetical protein HOD03_01145, partial [Planctomycetes bacterium]|nr:hypothetical protein [Planctomycetota bacterium]
GVIRAVPIDYLVSAAAEKEKIEDTSRIVFRGVVTQLNTLLWNTDGFLDFLIGKQIIESSPDTFSISSRAIGRVVEFIPDVLADRFLSNPLVPGLIVLEKNASYYAAFAPSFGSVKSEYEAKHISDEKHLFLSDAQILAHFKNEWARTDLSKKWVLESSIASIPLGFSVTCNDEVADIVLKGRRSNKFLIVSIANERSLEQVFLSAVKLQEYFEAKLNTRAIRVLVLTTFSFLDVPDWFSRQRDFDIEKISIAIESEKIK